MNVYMAAASGLPILPSPSRRLVQNEIRGYRERSYPPFHHLHLGLRVPCPLTDMHKKNTPFPTNVNLHRRHVWQGHRKRRQNYESFEDPRRRN